MRYEVGNIIRHIWRNKCTMLVTALFFGVSTLLCVLSLEYYLRELDTVQNRHIDYQRDVTGFAVTSIQERSQVEDVTGLLGAFSTVVGRNMLTWYSSNSLSKTYQCETILVFGDQSLIREEVVPSGIEVYSDTEIAELRIGDKVYPVKQRDLTSYKRLIGDVWSEQGANPLIVVASFGFPQEWLDIDQPNFLFSLVDHTVVAVDDTEKIESILELGRDSFMAIRPKSFTENQELAFITGYNLPFIILCLAAFFFCLHLIVTGMIEQQHRRLAIEYFFGAGLLRLCIRFGIAFFLLLLPGYGLYRWLRRMMRLAFVSDAMVIAAYGLIWLLYLGVTYCLLKRADLQSRMKGV